MMNNEKGMTLIEILVAIFIFGFGLLGIAGLQLSALSGAQSANHRSIANTKAYDLGERIRSNPNGAYDIASGSDGSCRTSHYINNNANPTNCTPTQLANDDVWDWKQELAKELAQGKGIVCIDSTPDDGTSSAPACDGSGQQYAIKVWWNEKPNGEVGEEKRIAISMVKS